MVPAQALLAAGSDPYLEDARGRRALELAEHEADTHAFHGIDRLLRVLGAPRGIVERVVRRLEGGTGGGVESLAKHHCRVFVSAFGGHEPREGGVCTRAAAAVVRRYRSYSGKYVP